MILDLGNLQRKYNLEFNGVLHIGAHAGQEMGTYKSLGIDPVIFIEPQPNIFKQLKSNVGDKAICLEMAVGNFEGEVDMWTNENDMNGSTSILQPHIHLQQYPHIVFDRRIKVPIRKVDNLDIPQCNFINIDIQGYELEALKGAAKYLEGVDYIMSEVNKEEVYKDCALIDSLDKYLSGFGFKRVETDWAGWTWGDAFYIKQK